MIVKARDMFYVIRASECGDSDRGSVWGSYCCFRFEIPAARDGIDAHGICGEKSGRDEERLEPFLKTLDVVLVEDDEGFREGIKVGDSRRRHGVDHSEESLKVLGGIVYVDD